MGVGLHFYDVSGKEVDYAHFTYSTFGDSFLEPFFPEKVEEYIKNQYCLWLYGEDACFLYKLCKLRRNVLEETELSEIDRVEII